MSFFDTEEAHTGMLATVADEGGRAAPEVTPTSLNRDISSGDGRPPGAAGKSRLKATAQFGAKKDIHIPHYYQVKQIKRSALFYGVKALILRTFEVYLFWPLGVKQVAFVRPEVAMRRRRFLLTKRDNFVYLNPNLT